MAIWIVLHLARFARERCTIEQLAKKAGVRCTRNCALWFSNFELLLPACYVSEDVARELCVPGAPPLQPVM
jgi:hypothetical protein